MSCTLPQPTFLDRSMVGSARAPASRSGHSGHGPEKERSFQRRRTWMRRPGFRGKVPIPRREFAQFGKITITIAVAALASFALVEIWDGTTAL